MKARHFSWAAILFVAVPQLHSVQRENCPDAEAANVKMNPYHFTYESWVEKGKSGKIFFFGRCVTTKNDKDLFVDWRKTNLKGFATPGFPLMIQLPSLTGEVELVQTELWYGSGPQKTKAPYREVKQKTEPQNEPLSTRVKMSVPREIGKDPAEGKDFVKVDMRLISEVEKMGKEYAYSYRWEPNDKAPSSTSPPVTFRWRSHMVAGAQNAKEYATLQVPDSPKGVRVLGRSEPVYAITIIEFLDRDGKQVVGTAPVAIYHPKGSKP